MPSHTIRLLMYRTLFGIKIGRNSTIHWLARFNNPAGVAIGHNSVIGNDAFLDGRYPRRLDNGKSRPGSYIQDFLGQGYRPLTIGDNVSTK